ncbi:sulfite exporter TauE/SafE family protein [Thalassotalea sp. 1_MG-2023]|uniref:sulfite exporter TauE/SafE family protein n=1 Tax=Thalassotalea sp. 1_MG-2023 TaxID=3062680 RepID=UPI0026E17D74|nr:sulfite exporter TauE/SafE family protein [Thalassotalea sp. 1_MG-2023]MDO6427781.1 sulfite exporter TauE/SafE family protein [Thalassotalea sp. 1_MG-2023]
MTLDYFSAFLIGILGAGHCIGMCGGISSMLTAAVKQHSRKSFYFVAAYNIGRIFTYSFLGLVAGFTGSLSIKALGLPVISLKFIAGFFLILLGLYIGQWLFWLNHVEKLGRTLWQKLQPISKHLLPIDSTSKALGLGMLWGWLPCGLIYSTLTWSIAAGNAIDGMAIMFFFGVGTLPALLTVSLGFQTITVMFKKLWVRRFIALGLICYGVFTLNVAYQLLF